MLSTYTNQNILNETGWVSDMSAQQPETLLNITDFANYLWGNNSRQPIRHLDIVPINQWDSEVKQPNVKHVHEPKHSKWFSLGTGGTLHSDEGLTLGTSPFMDDYTPKITFSLLLFRMLVMDGGRCTKDTF